jgi:hypothetical protein
MLTSTNKKTEMVDKLFECVKSTAQDKWSISRDWGYEEDDRAKQVGLWLNRPTSTQGKQPKLGPDGSINQVQHELGLDGSSVQTSVRKLKQSKLRRDGQIYSFLYEIENTVQTQDLRWTWDVWVSKVLEVVDRSVDHTMHSIGKQCRIVSSIDIEHEISDHDLLEMYLEHEAGIKLKKECRESRDKIEDVIRKLLRAKIMNEQLTDTARQTAYIRSLEDATRFQQRMMMTVNRQISGLRTEEEVIKSLREQKTIQFINVNTAKIIADNSIETSLECHQ